MSDTQEKPVPELKRALNINRKLIRGKLLKQRHFIDKFKDVAEEYNICEAKLRLESVVTYLKEYTDTFNETVPLEVDDAEIEKLQEDLFSFEDEFYEVTGLFVNVIEKVEGKDEKKPKTEKVESDENTQNARPIVKLKLPEFQLPKFDGKAGKWTQFRDSFEALIHKTKLPNIEKLLYLIECCKGGDAEPLLSVFQISSDNYEIAWKELQDRYDDKKLIVDEHITELIKFRPISNSNELRKLLNCYSSHIKQIEQIVEDKESLWNLIVVHMATYRLDNDVRKSWASKVKKNEIPTWDSMQKFLEEKCRVIDQMGNTSKTPNPVKVNSKPNTLSDKSNPKFQKPTSSFVVTNSNPNPDPNIKCRVCDGSHYSYQCDVILKLTNIPDRIAKIKEKRLCFNCLKPGHSVSACTNKKVCRECNQKHHTLIHDSSRGQSSESKSEEESKKAEKPKTSEVLVHCGFREASQEKIVLLTTAVVQVEDKFGNLHPCRALLDSGSESHFISEKMVQFLRLHKSKTNIQASGLFPEPVTITSTVQTSVQSFVSKFKETMQFLVVSKISNNTPSKRLSIPIDQIPTDIHLADPEFHKPNRIDMIIGAEFFLDIIRSNKKVIVPKQLFLRDSEFGWIAYGKAEIDDVLATHKIRCMMTLNQELSAQIERFWKIESFEEESSYSEEEKYCLNLFSTTTTRNEEGRFIVKLPMRANANQLQDNCKTAIRRFYQLEARLEKTPEIFEMYKKFMKEYEELNHLSEVKSSDVPEHAIIHYLPYHHVMKPTSTTTKLRMVFNASCKASNNLSLNDVLCVGPDIQEPLLVILLSFCCNAIGCVADVKMMYRQVLVDPNQRHMQRIVSRESPNQPIKHHTLNTLTYGTGPASFLSVSCLNYLAEVYESKYPEASKRIKKRCRVDDLLTGFNSIEEAREVIPQLNEIVASAKFHLRKWMSNVPEILEDLDQEDKEFVDFQKDDDFIMTLGLIWKPKSDKLAYKVQDVDVSTPITKRKITSSIAKLYDPMGRLNPVVLTGKILIQKLWSMKLEWDQEVPDEVQSMWIKFYQNFPILKSIEFDRNVIIPNPVQIELHGFSDASEVAYGSCFYIRSKNAKNEVKVQLYCARSRVAPLQNQTLPRKELMGAETLSELLQVVKRAFEHPISKVYLWTDSTIVLSWLKMSPGRLQVFVRNRVTKIQQMTDGCEWRYVNSKSNPADHVSRGLTPDQIIDNSMWWNGPDFLQQSEEFWPQNPNPPKQQEDTEVQSFVSVKQPKEPRIIQKCDSVYRLRRIFKYVSQFICNSSSNSKNPNLSSLTSRYKSNELLVIIKFIQNDRFHSEIAALSSQKEIAKSSNLKSLNVFLDSHQILRVGGRLKHSKLDDSQKYPILLPNHHVFTENLVRQIHNQNLHCSQSALLSFVRQQYWPIRAKDIVRKVVRTCLKCARFNAKPIIQFMGDLPSSRVQFKFPFFDVGIDYAGPISIKMGGPRSQADTKAYIAVFVCMAVKAVHLEAVSRLTSEAFIAAFDRFAARHGIPKNVYTDNGKNFVGASNIFKAIATLVQSQETQNGLIESNEKYEDIIWHFIPARSPNFGGLWEAAVKQVKTHLIKVVEGKLLTFEELATVLCRIENILNSRPLTQESEDPNDLKVLTPGHFLIGRPMNSRPQIELCSVPNNRLNRWEITQKMSQQFWQRWHSDYLHQLQQRSKWFSKKVELKVGTMVVLKEDNIPAYKWPIGRIINIHPGSDGIVRAATVRTTSGEYRLSVSKICMLPIMDEDVFGPENV